MHVRFWGTRGSIPAPGPRTAKYGGNTPCVELRTKDGTLIILDCGTGVRPLGLHLLKSSPLPLRINLLIGHTHWDHIQGFPFFNPAFLPDTELNIYAPLGFQRSVEQVLAGQMQYSYFPVTLRDLRSRIHFAELEEGCFRLGDVLIETQYLNHTAPTIAFRVSSDGTTVVYAPDHEPFWNATGRLFEHPGDQRHIAFLNGADLLIHDAQYSAEEYAGKVGWGHSTVEYATEIALIAGAGRLALFHHDPMHDDVEVGRLEDIARALVKARDASLEVFAAAEGRELDLHGHGTTPSAGEKSALQRRSIAGERVLVVSPHETAVAGVGQILAEDELVLFTAPDKHTALARVAETPPDLVIIDAHLPDGDGASLVQPLRARLGRPNLPVMLLTDSSGPEGARRFGDKGASDYLVKPLSPPMLRARVRAWLTRIPVSATADQVERLSPSFSSSSPQGLAEAAATDDGRTTLTDHASLRVPVPLLDSLNREQLAALVACAAEENYSAGHIIIQGGNPGEHLYVVLSGRVRLVEESADALRGIRFVGELGPGDVFGETALLLGQTPASRVVAVEPTRCLLVPQREFMRAFQSSADFSVTMLRILAARLANMNRLLPHADRDPLTGLIGRRAFHDQYRRMAASARRRSSSLTLLVFDILHLKTINDHFGYAIGDEVLRVVAEALLHSSRTMDLVARYGTDEFAVVLVDARQEHVDPILTRVQEKLDEMGHRHGLPLDVRCTIGVAVAEPPPESADELLRDADQDMNRKKA